MEDLAQGKYTEEEVKKALFFQDDSRNIFFRYELLGQKGNVIDKDIGNVVSCSVEYSSLAQVKCTASMELTQHQERNIDFLTEMIKPYFCLIMPDGGICEWPEGVFLLQTSGTKKSGVFKKNSISGYDKLVILLKDKFEKSYLIKKGTNVINAAISIIASAGIETINIPGSDLTLLTDKEFEPNTSKLTAINELLDIANYESLQAYSSGLLISKRYKSPEDKGVEFYYGKDQCVIYNDAEIEDDLFDACNVFSACVANPQLNTSLFATYTNNNMSSRISVPRLGRRVVKDVYQLSEGTTQQELEIYVRKKAFEESQIYSKISIDTVLMPHHTYLNTLSFDHDLLNGPTTFSETRWSKELRVGAKMKHYCRKIMEV